MEHAQDKERGYLIVGCRDDLQEAILYLTHPEPLLSCRSRDHAGYIRILAVHSAPSGLRAVSMVARFSEEAHKWPV